MAGYSEDILFSTLLGRAHKVNMQDIHTTNPAGFNCQRQLPLKIKASLSATFSASSNLTWTQDSKQTKQRGQGYLGKVFGVKEIHLKMKG